MNRIVALIILLYPGLVVGLELHLPVLYDGGKTERTEVQKQASYVAYDTIKSAGENVYRLHSLTNLENGNIWYVFSKNLVVYGVDVSQNKLVGTWPLSPYGGHLFLSGEYLAAAEEMSAVRGEDFSVSTNPLSVITNRPVSYYLDNLPEFLKSAGCFQKNPLRYGDINGDGSKELVLFLGQNFIIFSTELNEVIFSAHYWMSDELAADEVEISFPGDPNPDDPLFIADSGTDVLVRKKFPAWRSLSKIYFGDFDENGSHDIVVWRKLFESKKHGEEPGGFRGLGEVLVHYTFKDGKYVKESTPSSDIKNWLNDQDLKWKDGFPSKSECAGQEGEFIPELHDPLLNDPEILL